MRLGDFVGRLWLFPHIALTLMCGDDESVNGPTPEPGPCDNVTAGDVTTDPEYDGEPSWSPYCDDTAFTSLRSGNIVVVDPLDPCGRR